METVTLHTESEIAWLTMNRPEALNAFDQAMVDAMLARLKDLVADRRVMTLAPARAEIAAAQPLSDGSL